jgi:hypothetical protein
MPFLLALSVSFLCAAFTLHASVHSAQRQPLLYWFAFGVPLHLLSIFSPTGFRFVPMFYAT